ncbi:MAG TPA: hypothetical protein VHG91_18565 [Longimicrobium sp.]|nr:hypothetical protein [Longimicrobium sp.]
MTRSVRWRVDGRDLGPDDTISTSYMNRGQDRNLRAEGMRPCDFEVRIARADFDRLWALCAEALGEGEEDSPPLSLPADPERAARWVLDAETELLELLYVDEGEWKARHFFVHELTEAGIGPEEVVLRGVALFSADHNERKLRNLIRNVTDPALLRDHPNVVVDSVRELARGHRYAVDALPALRALAGDGSPEIAAEARAAAEAIERAAGPDAPEWPAASR